MKVLHYLNGQYKQIKRQLDIRQLNFIIKGDDFSCIQNLKPNSVKTVAFFLESMYRYAGGCTSILRLAKWLNKTGYKVIFVVCSGQTEKQFRDNARTNLEEFPYIVKNYKDCNKKAADVYIATAWQTVYFVRRFEGYKMYFVQDYEPYFYEYGEKYLLARKTYELGLHMISLGPWNLEKIKKECSPISLMEQITFPVEKSEYRYLKRDFSGYAKKKEIKLAVYIKDDGKRMPILLQIMMKELQRDFQEVGIKLSVLWYGWEKRKKVACGINLGKLTKIELEKLYHSVDFGMTASITNISLVPVEMMASGLPLIEFKEGSFQSFFGDDCAILTGFSHRELFNALSTSIRKPIELERMVERAYQSLFGLEWPDTCKQFERMIRGLTEKI